MLQNHAQVYLGTCQTSIVELLTIFAKSSIIDVWGGPKYTTGHDERLTRNNQEIKPFPANIYLFKDNNRMFKVNNKNTRTMLLTSFWCFYY